MAKAEEHVIDINIDTHDKTGPGVESATKKLNSFDKAIDKTKSRLQEMTKGEYTVALSALDKISPVVGRARSALRGFAGGKPHDVMLSAVDKVSGHVRAIKAGLSDLTSKAYTVTVRTKNALQEKAGGALSGASGMALGMPLGMAAGAGMAFGGYDTVKTFMDFEHQMSAVAALSGSSKEELEQLTAKAREMGASTAFSATEAGKAFEYMAQAGWGTEQMINGIEGVMDLAAASGEDLGHTSEILTGTLTAFGLAASDAGMAADVLAQAAASSNTSVGEMGESFKYVGPIAGAMKYSIQDVSLALGMMANMNIKGSEAGTSLRAILTRLVNPPKQAAEAIARLGLEVSNADGTMRPLRDVLKDLRGSFAGLSDEEKASTAASLAGQEAMSGLLSLVNGTDDDFAKLANDIDTSNGAAKRMADIRLDNLKGDLENLSGAWEDFQIELMTGKGSAGLRSFVQAAADELNKFKESLKDGFDIGDIVGVAKDILQGLIDKTKELSGVGSAVSGAILAVGAYKGYKLGKKAYGAVDGLINGSGGGGSEAAGEALGKEAVINAQTVIVNGKNVSGSATGAAGSAVEAVGAGAGAAGGVKGAGRMARLGNAARTLGRAAVPLAIAAGAYDIYNAKDGEKASTMGNVGGGLIGGLAGAKAGAAAGGALGAAFGGVGAVPGAAIGGLAGGIGGYMLGGDIGEKIGGAIGDIDFSGKWSSIKEGAAETWAWIGGKAAEAIASVEDAWSGLCSWIGSNVWEPIKSTAIDALNVIVGIGATVWEMIEPYWEGAVEWFDSTVWQPISELATAAWDGICGICSSAWDTVAGYWGVAGDWFGTTVWQPIDDAASAVWADASAAIGAAWDYLQGVWSEASSWFGATVWQPISAGVDVATNAINSAFDTALSTIKGIWGSLGSWFEENVWGPISSRASTLYEGISSKLSDLRSKGSSITGLGANEPEHAAGGIMFNRHRGVVAEAGPEAIVPLSASRRDRGFDIWQKAGQMLGVDFGDDGSDTSFGGVPFDPFGGSPAPAPAANGPTVHIEVSATPAFSISGDGQDPESIMAVVRSHAREMADDIGDEIAEKLAGIFGNQPVKAG